MREEKRTYVWDRKERKRENAMGERENACYGSDKVTMRERERERERERDS